jgi:hypothetical protein
MQNNGLLSLCFSYAQRQCFISCYWDFKNQKVTQPHGKTSNCQSSKAQDSWDTHKIAPPDGTGSPAVRGVFLPRAQRDSVTCHHLRKLSCWYQAGSMCWTQHCFPQFLHSYRRRAPSSSPAQPLAFSLPIAVGSPSSPLHALSLNS